MPNSAATHNQNKAPGPPVAIAVPTPEMLETPTDPPMAMDTAWKGVSFWALSGISGSFLKGWVMILPK